MAHNELSKILVICLPGIGDSLMATPLIRKLKAEFPLASIDVLCMFEGVKVVFENNPHIRRVHCIKLFNHYLGLNELRKLWSLRAAAYDCSLLAHPAYRREYHLLHRFLGAKMRIAHAHSAGFFSEAHFLATDLVDLDESVHNVDNNLNLLGPLKVSRTPPPDRTYDLSLDPSVSVYAKKWFKSQAWDPQQTIAIHPGSTLSGTAILKRWPIDRFIELSERLIAEKGRKVIVFVGPDELPLGSEIESALKKRGLKDSVFLATGLNLKQALGLLAETCGLVTNDNGFAHLSAALKVPVVALFGPTNPVWTAPLGTGSIKVIKPPEAFNPWFRYELKRQAPKGVQSGMESITVKHVFDECP